MTPRLHLVLHPRSYNWLGVLWQASGHWQLGAFSAGVHDALQRAKRRTVGNRSSLASRGQRDTDQLPSVRTDWPPSDSIAVLGKKSAGTDSAELLVGINISTRG
jgi:hypothetical protein